MGGASVAVPACFLVDEDVMLSPLSINNCSEVGSKAFNSLVGTYSLVT